MHADWPSEILHASVTHRWTIGVWVVIAISYAGLLAHRRHQGSLVRSWLNGLVATASGHERRIAVTITARLHKMRRQTQRDPLMPVVGSVLGATPGAVLKHGGCCAGLSRLCIVSLAEMGIPARQITLYHRGTSKAQHCLVEAFPSAESLIIDPAYGLYYADEHGRGISLAHLRQGVIPVLYNCESGERSSYPAYSYYDFDFTATKTANWTKNQVRRRAHRLLHVVTRGAIDHVGLPPWLEWPQWQFVVLITIAAVVHAAVMLLTAIQLG